MSKITPSPDAPLSQRASLDEIRGFFAKLMAAASRSADPRLERAFEIVPREAFLPPGPWHMMWADVADRYFETPSADPAYLYQNALVAIDASKGINNGEPFLHARWIGAVAPEAGETVTHIGCGTGYYSAILSILVLPGGRVLALDINEELAAAARRNLAPFENVSVAAGDATAERLQSSDIIYVNAGLACPPVHWLMALRPGGRLIFPWRPSDEVALATVVTRKRAGLSVRPLMGAWFIPCSGTVRPQDCVRRPTPPEAEATRSVHLIAERAPDSTATAICRDVWFSSAEV